MPVRTAEAVWTGKLRDGKGTVKLPVLGCEGEYSFPSRFEQGQGTNPEELIAAAHAGCFSMALSGELVKAGFTPGRIHTTADVHLDKTGDGFSITRVDLHTEAEVPGASDEAFQQAAQAAKKGCPVSRALSSIEVTLDAKLL